MANKRLNTAYILKESFARLRDCKTEGWAKRFFDNRRSSPRGCGIPHSIGRRPFIIDSLPVGILTVNPQMRITSFNPWAETLTGYSQNEVLGRYCGEILQGGMCKLHCPLKTAIGRHQPILRVETTIQNKAGEVIPVRMHTAALLNNEGGLIGAVEAFQDISSLKAMEREKDNLISMFAHDMKSSLTIIGGFALRLRKKAADLDEQKHNEYLGIIQKETERLDSFVSDFLEFARLQTGKLKLNFQEALRFLRAVIKVKIRAKGS